MKLTPWFPGHIKPARPGVYQQMADGMLGYQCWSGSVWYGWSTSIDMAADDYCQVGSRFQNDSWRGLAEDPSESCPGGFFQSLEALDMGK